MYGVSKATEGFTTGTFNEVIGRDISFLWTVDKSGRVFWFAFQKMDKVYHVPDLPRFTEQDALSLAQLCMPMYLTEKCTFGDLWNNRIANKLVALEEAWYKHWNWGRFICIGDAIHKVCKTWHGYQ
jgi:hypothetical protein